MTVGSLDGALARWNDLLKPVHNVDCILAKHQNALAHLQPDAPLRIVNGLQRS